MNQAIQLHQGTDLKLRDFQPSDLVNITTTLIGLSTLMGLRELTGLEAVAISDFIAEEFKDFTLEEVQNAFKMNSAGKLLDPKGEKTKPYGSLNIDYVGTVLALYRTYRTNELRKINIAAPIPMKTEEQKDAILKQVMAEIFDEMNTLYQNNRIKFTYSAGIKFYGCLKYYNMMPDYKSAELWEKSKRMMMDKLMLTLDKQNRIMIAYLKDSKLSVSYDIKNKVRIGIEGNYKGLLASKALEDFQDMCDNLEEVKE